MRICGYTYSSCAVVQLGRVDPGEILYPIARGLDRLRTTAMVEFR